MKAEFQTINLSSWSTFELTPEQSYDRLNIWNVYSAKIHFLANAIFQQCKYFYPFLSAKTFQVLNRSYPQRVHTDAVPFKVFTRQWPDLHGIGICFRILSPSRCCLSSEDCLNSLSLRNLVFKCLLLDILLLSSCMSPVEVSIQYYVDIYCEFMVMLLCTALPIRHLGYSFMYTRILYYRYAVVFILYSHAHRILIHMFRIL